MSADADPLTLLDRALEQTAEVIDRVRPEQATLPTPCASWDVRELVNHMVIDAQHFTASVRGERWEGRQGDVIGADWAGAFRSAAAELLEAWRREGVVGRTLHLPFGDVPATWSVGQQAANFAVRGWDVAMASGQSTELDQDVGRASVEWGRRTSRTSSGATSTAGSPSVRRSPCPTTRRSTPGSRASSDETRTGIGRSARPGDDDAMLGHR